MLWALGSARFLGQLGTYLAAAIQWCSERMNPVKKDEIQVTIKLRDSTCAARYELREFAQLPICQDMSSYEATAQDLGRIPEKRPWEHVDAAHCPPQEFGAVFMSKSGSLHMENPCFGSACQQHCQAVKCSVHLCQTIRYLTSCLASHYSVFL